MLSIAVPLTAQNNSKEKNKKELTVEELYLKDIEFQILKEKAFSNDRDMKLKALDDLEKQINEGSVNKDNREVEFILEYLSMEGIGRKVLENRRLTNYFPEVRRRACNLLGKIGGEQAKNALIAVLLNDNEPMVKSEAAYALGNIGLNDNNEVVKALLFALNQQDPTRVDNNFAYAIILSLEKIAKKNKSKYVYLFNLLEKKDLEDGLHPNSIGHLEMYKLIKKESIKTVLGKKDALVIELDFEKISTSNKENTDMLTNNLVDEDKNLIFWISDDDKRIPLKAKFTMKPFAVSWELLKYEE